MWVSLPLKHTYTHKYKKKVTIFQEWQNQENAQGQVLQYKHKPFAMSSHQEYEQRGGRGRLIFIKQLVMCQVLPHTLSHLIFPQYINFFICDKTHELGLERLCKEPRMTKHSFYSHSATLCCSVSVNVISTSEHKLHVGVKKENWEWMCFSTRSPSGMGEGWSPDSGGGSQQLKVPIEGSPKSLCFVIAIYGNLKQ